MKDSFSTGYGKVIIDNNVLVRVAGMAALECAGIVGMSSVNKKDGVIKLLTRNSVSKGIKAVTDGDKVSLEFHIIVAFGVSIPTIVTNLIETVSYRMEASIGFKVSNVVVFVEGVRVID